MNTLRIRRILARLAKAGVLIGYTVSMRYGQSVMVWGEDGRPVRMCMASADMYGRRLEAMEWGLYKAPAVRAR